jgi:NADH-quinone oxidoreductase subunit K
MNGVPIAAYLALAMFMFICGAVGVVVRRNPIRIFMCVELMLNSVNLTFLTFARYRIAHPNSASIDAAHSAMAGQMMVIFVMAVAAAEVAVGLGIIMTIFRSRNNVDVDELNLLRG